MTLQVFARGSTVARFGYSTLALCRVPSRGSQCTICRVPSRGSQCTITLSNVRKGEEERVRQRVFDVSDRVSDGVLQIQAL